MNEEEITKIIKSIDFDKSKDFVVGTKRGWFSSSGIKKLAYALANKIKKLNECCECKNPVRGLVGYEGAIPPYCKLCGKPLNQPEKDCSGLDTFKFYASLNDKLEKETRFRECPHCKENIYIRNPSGYCDHLYYPDNCKICQDMRKPEKKQFVTKPNTWSDSEDLPDEIGKIEKLEYSRYNYEMARNSPNKDTPTSVWWEDMCRIKDKLNEVITKLNKTHLE